MLVGSMREYFRESLQDSLRKRGVQLSDTAQVYVVNLLTEFARSDNAFAGTDRGEKPILADLLVRAGVDRGRGFVTNVANFQRTRDEVAWAEDVRAELRRRGVRRVRYAIDTSRNGAGPSTAEGWCNPSIARLGRRPTMRRVGARDGFLWVKRPGESDGDCGKGTPPAGHWWPDGALALTGWSPR